MPQMFSNAARTSLASGISNSDTTFVLASGGGSLFPVADTDTGSVGGTSKWFRAVLDNGIDIEVVYIRTHAASADSFSNVQRAQEGTSAASWSAGSTIGLRITAADMEPPHAMSVHRSAAVNTTAAGWQKLSMDSTGYDTGLIWSDANRRATPIRPGYYQVTVRVQLTVSTDPLIAGLYKNGSLAARVGAHVNGLAFGAGGSFVVYCNGTTDYLEPWFFSLSIVAVTTGAAQSHFQILGPF
jgi:hypothetical protein